MDEISIDRNNEYRILIKIYNSDNISRVLQKLVNGEWCDVCDMNTLEVSIQNLIN